MIRSIYFLFYLVVFFSIHEKGAEAKDLSEYIKEYRTFSSKDVIEKCENANSRIPDEFRKKYVAIFDENGVVGKLDQFENFICLSGGELLNFTPPSSSNSGASLSNINIKHSDGYSIKLLECRLNDDTTKIYCPLMLVAGSGNLMSLDNPDLLKSILANSYMYLASQSKYADPSRKFLDEASYSILEARRRSDKKNHRPGWISHLEAADAVADIFKFWRQKKLGPLPSLFGDAKVKSLSLLCTRDMYHYTENNKSIRRCLAHVNSTYKPSIQLGVEGAESTVAPVRNLFQQLADLDTSRRSRDRALLREVYVTFHDEHNGVVLDWISDELSQEEINEWLSNIY